MDVRLYCCVARDERNSDGTSRDTASLNFVCLTVTLSGDTRLLRTRYEVVSPSMAMSASVLGGNYCSKSQWKWSDLPDYLRRDPTHQMYLDRKGLRSMLVNIGR